MKNILTQFFRIVIGALFVFSGFVKLIDPLGSAYKFEEYFSADVLNLEFLIPYSLYLSIFLILAEITLGAMLLFGYKAKFTVWSLFILMLLFLFLTWYSAYFDKVKDCGCFGDFIKLTSWETFYKNVAFTPMILWLIYDYHNIRPIYSMKFSRFLTVLSFIGFSFITYYVLHHLPIIDFRAFAIGKNIPEQMIYPEGAKEDVFEEEWIYNINGEDKIFTTEDKPWDIKGAVFVDRKTKLIEKGYEPPIHDFTMENAYGVDLTKQLMNEEKLMLIISPSLDKSDIYGFENIKIITDKALDNGYIVFIMTASSREQFNDIKEEFNLDFDMLSCDETTLKTMIRSNPGIMTINKGTVEGKWSYNDWEKVKIKEGMGRRTTTINFELKKQLEDIFENDQKYRLIMDAETPRKRDSLMVIYGVPKDSIGTDFFTKQQQLDAENMQKIDQIIAQYGYPGKSLVGEINKDVAWSVIMHSKSVAKYIDLIKEAAEKNEMSYPKAAEMEDLYLMLNGLPQKYGTQTAYINEKVTFWPIEDVEYVNTRRKEADFGLTIQQYAKELFGKSYIFEPITMEDVKRDPAYYDRVVAAELNNTQKATDTLEANQETKQQTDNNTEAKIKEVVEVVEDTLTKTSKKTKTVKDTIE